MNDQEILYWLNEQDPSKVQDFFNKAYQIKLSNVGDKVYFRGIIELSNICNKNCFYCGIRKDSVAKRYLMTIDEVCEAADFAYRNGYGSLVIQAGEQTNNHYVEYISEMIKRIKGLSHGNLGITLSLGEQKKEIYQKWFNLGAHRYLLRIETSSEKLYKKLHPRNHSFLRRKECLTDLKEVGYQVGTGVMIGLPGQSDIDLCRDIRFFQEMDIDMIGMGPYVPHDQTPYRDVPTNLKRNFQLSLKMISLIRFLMPDINIAATTALQAIDPLGREKALKAGANIIMPNITPQGYRADYQLYNNKPCTQEDSAECIKCLESRIFSIGEKIGYNEWGDSPHFKYRKEAVYEK